MMQPTNSVIPGTTYCGNIDNLNGLFWQKVKVVLKNIWKHSIQYVETRRIKWIQVTNNETQHMKNSLMVTLILADEENLKFENTAYRNKKNQMNS